MKYTAGVGKVIVCLIVICFTLQVEGFDTTLIKNAQSWVYDETSTLGESEKTVLENKIQQLRNQYSVEILVVLLKNTQGEDISKLAVDIGQNLGVGKSDVDNGLVILIALEQRKWFIATGYGLEGSIPDIIAARIGNSSFPSYFRNGQYSEGILAALNQVEGYIKNDSSVISSLDDTQNSNIDGSFILWYFFAVFFISSFLFYNDFKNKEYASYGKKLLLAYLVSLPIAYALLGVTALLINMFIWLFTSLWVNGNRSSGGGFSRGGGGFSSGGGGGFGGGGFGGGGAGGRW